MWGEVWWGGVLGKIPLTLQSMVYLGWIFFLVSWSGLGFKPTNRPGPSHWYTDLLQRRRTSLCWGDEGPSSDKHEYTTIAPMEKMQQIDDRSSVTFFFLKLDLRLHCPFDLS